MKKRGRPRIDELISGVYILKSKSIPSICYIGSSGNIIRRIKNHLIKLKNNSSGHLLLQDHVNNYGIKDLRFIILKRCHKDHINYWEQYFISEINPPLNSFRFTTFKQSNNVNIMKLVEKEIVEESNSPLVKDEIIILRGLKDFDDRIIHINLY
jgi:group I intron endonuclease